MLSRRLNKVSRHSLWSSVIVKLQTLRRFVSSSDLKASATLQLRKYPLDLVLSSISTMEAIGKVAVSDVWCVDVVDLPRKQSCVGSG